MPSEAPRQMPSRTFGGIGTRIVSGFCRISSAGSLIKEKPHPLDDCIHCPASPSASWRTSSRMSGSPANSHASSLTFAGSLASSPSGASSTERIAKPPLVSFRRRISEHSVEAYSTLYGMDPRHFEFNRKGEMQLTDDGIANELNEILTAAIGPTMKQ